MICPNYFFNSIKVMYEHLVWVLLLNIDAVIGCPDECSCSQDYEYDDGILVDCENLALNEIPFDIPSHVTTLYVPFIHSINWY